MVPAPLVTDKEVEAWGREVARESRAQEVASHTSCRVPPLQTTVHPTAALTGGHSPLRACFSLDASGRVTFVLINTLLVSSSDNGHSPPK